jgi:hypothetical protein
LVREGGGAGLGRRPHRWEGGGGLAWRDVERRGGRAVGPGAEARGSEGAEVDGQR